MYFLRAQLANIIGFIIIVFACLTANGQNQSFSFERIPTQKWLHQNNINCVTQDNQGFLWFGTNNGMYRFDGYSVAEFKHETHNSNSIAHNNVNHLYIDKAGVLWIGSWGGLTSYNMSTGIFTRYKHDPKNIRSLSNNDVRSIIQDDAGNYWIGTFGGGLNKLNIQTEEFTNYTYTSKRANSIPSNYVNHMICDQSGDLWIGTRRGLCKLELDNMRFITFNKTIKESDETQTVNVTSVYQEDAGAIVFGSSSHGLFRMDRKRGLIQRFNVSDNKDGLVSNHVQAICEEEPGKIWVGTPEGVNIVDVRKNEISKIQFSPENPSGLISNDVKCIFKDRSGLIWLVTGEGINISTKLNKRFRKFQRSQKKNGSLSNNFIYSFNELSDGKILIGNREGLDVFDRSSLQFQKFPIQVFDETDEVSVTVKDIHVNQKGDLLLGTSTGLFIKKNGQDEFNVYRYNPININSITNEINVIFEARDGEIWLGARKGLMKFMPDSGRFTLFRPGVVSEGNQLNSSVYSILEDRFGRFWIGTMGGGLSEFNRKTETFNTFVHNPLDSTSISNNSIISLYEDQFGFFWIGTYGGGLSRMDYKTSKFFSFSEQNGLPADVIYSINEDAKGNLWLTTNNGLVKFDTRNKTFRNYDALDGLQSNEFNINSSLKAKNGEIYIGGNAGFNLFHPDGIAENNFIPPTAITSFRVMDIPMLIQSEKEVKLAYNQNYITFEFASLSYALIDKNQYAYKLEGFDNEWVYCGTRRFVSYSNLGPGKYIFRVKSSNSDGLWNETGAAIQLTIDRPFWKTWWFILFIVLFFGGGLFLSYKLRIRSINKQNLLLEEKVRQRTAQLEQAIEESQSARQAAEKASRSKSGFLANMSHEIRTPLNGILGFTDLLIRNNEGHEMIRFLQLIRSSGDTLLKLLSDILDLNKIEQGKLTIEAIRFNFVQVISDTLLAYQYRANEKGLQFMLQFDPRIPNFINGDPTRIKQLVINLVSNSIKFTEEGGISVNFEIDGPIDENGNFFIKGIISDSGIGVPVEKQNLIFESFTQADGTFTRKYGGSGLGLSIVKQLLRLMNGDIQLNSPLIEKPFKSESPGAEFIFRFSVKEEPEEDISIENKKSASPVYQKFSDEVRVLLVEDNKINQLLAQTILENFGATVITADDGLQGVGKIKEADFDIILMDVQMPVMNGYESTASIRQMGIMTPIIGLTANVYKEDVEKCLESGMNAHLGKPFTEADLFNEMKRWI